MRPESTPTEHPTKATIELTPAQIALIEALRKKDYPFLADAYEAGIKIIWLALKEDIFENGFIPKNI